MSCSGAPAAFHAQKPRLAEPPGQSASRSWIFHFSSVERVGFRSQVADLRLGELRLVGDGDSLELRRKKKGRAR